MSLSLIPASRFRTMVWKNGGGTTTEMLASPEGAGLADFDWRISMARVESDGPFSCFEGIDRTIAILDGAGLILTPHERGAITLNRDSPPFAFPGDLPLTAGLIDGPITDLNIMTRRGRFRAFVSRLQSRTVHNLTTLAGTTLVLAACPLVAHVNDQSVATKTNDLIRVDGTGLSLTLAAPSSGQAIDLHLIEIWSLT